MLGFRINGETPLKRFTSVALTGNSLSGRWPWTVAETVKKYGTFCKLTRLFRTNSIGDVVRIAPNELVFSTPQALKGNRVNCHSINFNQLTL